MISDPDDQIRRMNNRHAVKKTPLSKAEETRLHQDAIRAAVVAKLLGGKSLDIAIADLLEFQNHNVNYHTYEDELAATPERRIRLKVTATKE